MSEFLVWNGLVTRLQRALIGPGLPPVRGDTASPARRPLQEATSSDSRGADPNRVSASPTVTKPTAS